MTGWSGSAFLPLFLLAGNFSPQQGKPYPASIAGGGFVGIRGSSEGHKKKNSTNERKKNYYKVSSNRVGREKLTKDLLK